MLGTNKNKNKSPPKYACVDDHPTLSGRYWCVYYINIGSVYILGGSKQPPITSLPMNTATGWTGGARANKNKNKSPPKYACVDGVTSVRVGYWCLYYMNIGSVYILGWSKQPPVGGLPMNTATGWTGGARDK